MAIGHPADVTADIFRLCAIVCRYGHQDLDRALSQPKWKLSGFTRALVDLMKEENRESEHSAVGG